MKLKSTLLALGLFAMTTPALGSSIVLGESQGSACYQEAKFGHSGREALKTCNAALTDGLLTHKDIAATYVNRGIVRSTSGDLDGAIDDYNHALQLNPLLGEAFANRGTVYIRTAKYSEALVELDRALSLELEAPANVYYNRAIVYEHLGDTSSAYHDYRKAAELKPEWDSPRVELTRFVVESD
jgi:tetratricopeptide (TPR) repeat protein